MKIRSFLSLFFDGIIRRLLGNPQVGYYKILFGICKNYYVPILTKYAIAKLMYLGFYEYEIAKYVKKFVRRGACCYDIGSTEGYYICAFNKLSCGGKIYAFEPDPYWQNILLRVSKLNNINNLEYVQQFVTDNVSLDTNSITIDYMVLERKAVPPEIIKVDIEGGEYKFLCGAEYTINKYNPKLIIEIHSKELEDNCRAFLTARGYEIKIINQVFLINWYRTSKHNNWLVASLNGQDLIIRR